MSEPARFSDSIVSILRAKIRGDVIVPNDPQYDSARRVYNRMIDKKPSLIVQCVDVADVIAIVNFARESGTTMAIRGGGHNAPGFGTCDDGIVCDLSKMRGTRVDLSSQTIRVDGGCCWADVDHATYPFGMAVPCGFISSTGVGGLTLGGGIGYLARKYGLTIDNLLEVDIVPADGKLYKANEKENKDLFWAVRGGGGNFGAVTSFLFRMNPAKSVYGGPMLWPLDEAGEILKFWREFILEAPEELNGWFGLVTVPPAPQFPQEYQLKKMCMICWCFLGEKEEANKAFAAIRNSHKPAIDFAGPIPLPALNSLFDPLYPANLNSYWRADFFKTISDQSIDIHLKYGSMLPTPLSTMHLYPVDGAAQRVSSADTAWNCRDANFAGVIVGFDPAPEKCDSFIQWTKDYWNELHPHSMRAAYVNMFMDEGTTHVKAAYGANYDRLASIKAVYDPKNMFCYNQNIKPQGF